MTFIQTLHQSCAAKEMFRPLQGAVESRRECVIVLRWHYTHVHIQLHEHTNTLSSTSTNMHTHTHTHTLLTPCPSWTPGRIHLLYSVTDWDMAADLGWCIAALHSLLSITISCQSAILIRSLLIRSTHCKDVPPGLLFFPLGLYLRSCFCGRWSGILCRCPNHWSLFSLNCSSILVAPQSPPICQHALHCLSHRVTTMMSRRHFIWKVFSLLIDVVLGYWPGLCTVEED